MLAAAAAAPDIMNVWPLLRRPSGPRHRCLMTPTAVTPPTPIHADVEVVAPAAEGLNDEEDETTIFLDRERIASAAWMPLLLSKRSLRQRERRERRELRGGGLLSAITDERKERACWRQQRQLRR